jgi:protein regulator of cytokinesis 1
LYDVWFRNDLPEYHTQPFYLPFQDQKKINDQLAAEQEKLFGSKPSPGRPQSAKKLPGPRANGGAVNGTPNRRLSVLQTGVRSASRDGRKESIRPSAPVNYVSLAKDDVASQASST